jgi:hypothetical protein
VVTLKLTLTSADANKVAEREFFQSFQKVVICQHFTNVNHYSVSDLSKNSVWRKIS